MAKPDEVPSYPCMMTPADLRRVHHPHDERMVVRRTWLRRLLSKLAVTIRP